MSKFEISEDIINRTKQCHSNFYCLINEENPQCPVGLALCPVESDIGEGMVIVNCKKPFSCGYSITFGTDRRVCNCPVRYEIYQRYRK